MSRRREGNWRQDPDPSRVGREFPVPLRTLILINDLESITFIILKFVVVLQIDLCSKNVLIFLFDAFLADHLHLHFVHIDVLILHSLMTCLFKI